jgi:alpha-glucosidase
VHEIIGGLRAVVDEFDDRLLIGEIYLPIDRLVAYYGEDLSGVHLPFNFALMESSWDARAIANRIFEYEAALPPGGWPNWVLGNHDRPRIASRIGRAQARIAAMLLLTLRGTPTLYYGDEIGMQQVAISPEHMRDPFEKNVPGLGLGRDGERTPMQWNAMPFAGFSETEPWLPVADDAGTVNVADQRRDGCSLLNLYRDLIQLRRSHRALQFGTYRPIEASGDLLLFARELPEERLVVALNLGTARFRLWSAGLGGRIIVSSRCDRQGETIRDAFELHEEEGLVIQLAGDARVPVGIDMILVGAGH